MIKCVIFDMDGTLLDTEKFFKGAWVKTSEKWGLDGGEEFYVNVAGRPVHTLKGLFMETYNKTDEEFQAFVKERIEMVWDMLEKNVPVKPYCFELLEFLKQRGIPMALATSTGMYIAKRNMEITGIGNYLDLMVTGEMVQNGKPAPDIFLLAANSLGIDPEDCIVVEDSYNGLRGAYAAKMQPVMVIDEQEPNEETRRITVAECADLQEVLDFIKENTAN